MKNLSKGMLLFAALTAGLASCSDESPWNGSDSQGGINLNFSSDARVMRMTRADDTVSPVVPEANQFTVQLTKSDGTYSQSWSGIEAFNREQAFPIGDYTLKASFGSLETEGFNNPYFCGTAENVHVSPGASTEATVVATLANSMVSVRYTDEFKENFSAYSAAVQSEGHEWVVFAQNEDRPAYVSPSLVKLNLTLTNAKNEQVTIQPAEFTAVARHHYVVTVGVTGQPNNDLALSVVFDDDVVAETVEVSLGEELFSAPAPVIKTIGFNTGDNLEAIEHTPAANPMAFDVFAFGGLKDVTLTVVSDGYTPAFGSSVELVGANASTQQQLKAAGIECAGVFNGKVDKMAHIDFTKFLSSLPEGEYTIRVQAVDNLTRTTEPAAFAASFAKLEMALEAEGTAQFLGDNIAVDIETNSRQIKDQVKFKVPNANNQMVDATIISVSEIGGAQGMQSRSAGSYKFRYVLGLERQIRPSIDVIAIIGEITQTVSIPMDIPEFTLTPDAFSNKVLIKVEGANSDETDLIMRNLVFYNGSSVVPSSNVSMANGLVTIVGLTPGVQYVALKAKLGSIEKQVPAFTTETELDVPNGDFSQVGVTYNSREIYTGGQFKVGALDYYMKSEISYEEPQGWATINTKTCYDSSNPRNTWFMVPSTFLSSNATVIRSVGYNHSGKLPAKTGNFWSTDYYCSGAPAKQDFNKAAGELFLGSYTCNGNSETRVDGIEFASRPANLSFYFKYEPVNSEKAEVYITLYDASDNVLVKKTEKLSEVGVMTPMSISLTGYPFGAKAVKLVLGFRSTEKGVTPTIVIPTGSALNEGKLLTNLTVDANKYKAKAIGSVLTVDNVRLGYGSHNGPSTKPAKKSRR